MFVNILKVKTPLFPFVLTCVTPPPTISANVIYEWPLKGITTLQSLITPYSVILDATPSLQSFWAYQGNSSVILVPYATYHVEDQGPPSIH